VNGGIRRPEPGYVLSGIIRLRTRQAHSQAGCHVELGVQRQASAVARGAADCIYVLARVLLDIAVDS